MRFVLGLVALIVGMTAGLPSSAETLVSCPDLGGARRVGTCPSESELRHYWDETCVRQRAESNNPNVPECAKYETFAKLKDVALWEAGPEADPFQGYLGCGAQGAKIKQSKAIDVALECASTACKLTCFYENGFTMIARAPAICRLPGKDKPVLGIGKVSCGTPGTDCAVRCD
ncbi:MAG: hypothetical protein H7841_07245 [Magnetospirillum sp. WYHS-4]